MPKRLPDPIDVYLGDRLRARRLALGLSQAELAAGLSLTYQQVQKYENGINCMGASRLRQAAAILKVPIDHFYQGGPGHGKFKKDASSTDFLAEFFVSREGPALAKAFGEIKERDMRHRIVRLVCEIAERSA